MLSYVENFKEFPPAMHSGIGTLSKRDLFLFCSVCKYTDHAAYAAIRNSHIKVLSVNAIKTPYGVVKVQNYTKVDLYPQS